MKKILYLTFVVVLAAGLSLCLFSCSKGNGVKTPSDGTQQTSGAAGTEDLDSVPDTDPDTSADTEADTPVVEPTPEGVYVTGVNVNGLEDPNNFWKLMTAPKVLQSKETYENIRSQGFDHVRIPVPFHSYYIAESDSLDETKMAVVDTAIDLALEQGLGVMLDLHGWYEIDPTNAEDNAKFKAIWRLVSERYQDKPEALMFELMNEPHFKKNTATLMNFEMEVVEIIRATNPTRLILCAGPDANQAWKLNEVNLPNDPNLAVAVHVYNPGDFTHQGQVWAGHEAGKQVRLTEAHIGTLKWDLEEIEKFIDRTGVRVVLNETGMNVALADEADTDRYIRIISKFCRDNGIPLAWWSYDGGDFALYANGKWRTKVLDALFLR